MNRQKNGRHRLRWHPRTFTPQRGGLLCAEPTINESFQQSPTTFVGSTNEPYRFKPAEQAAFARFAQHQKQMRAKIGEANLSRLLAHPKRCVIFAMAEGVNHSPNLSHIYELFGDGVVLLALPCGTKELELPGWQSISFEHTRSSGYQGKLEAAERRGGNIAIRFGPGGFFGVDIDHDQKLDWFLERYPLAKKTLRRRGARGATFCFRLEDAYPLGGGSFNLWDEAGKKFGELRIGGGKGAYSVLWGLHPSGVRYQFENDMAVLTIDGSDFADLLEVLGLDYQKVFSGEENADPQTEARQRAGDQKFQQEQKREPRKLRGTSIIDYAERPIDFSKVLLGNRWLSRAQGAFVVAPSGHGKSTLVIQAAILWSCGRVAFGIKPHYPMRILVLQSEDDDNDVIEMAWMIDRLGLTDAEKALVRKNTHVEWLNDVAGQSFFPVADDFLTEFRPDILVINPYTAYQGGDIKDDELNNDFLRVHLSALLTRHNCGALPIHHTPKTTFQNREKFSWFDWMYSMAGGGALTNWARGILVIVPTDTPGIYRFIAAKRFEKIGWTEREYWYAHSIDQNRMLWVPATLEQIAGAQSGRRGDPEDLLTIIPPLDPILQEQLWVLAKKKLGAGERATRNNVKILLHDRKIFAHPIPREGAKSAIGYAKSPPGED